MVDARPCPVCAATVAEVELLVEDQHTGTGTWPILSCGGCGVFFTGGVDVDPQQIYPDGYDPYEAVAATPWALVTEYLARRSPRIRPLVAMAAAGPLLDVGCGSGLGLRHLRGEGTSAYGVDVTVSALRRAPRGTVSVADFMALPFKDATFAGLNLHHVLEHTDEPVRLLRELSRVLRNDGLMRVAVPVVASLWPRRADARHHAWEVPRHRVHFTPETFTRTVSMAGLRVARTRHYPEPGIRLLSHPATSRQPAARLARRTLATSAEVVGLLRYRQTVVLEAIVRKD